MSSIFSGGAKQVDYAAIEKQRKAEAAAEAAAEEKAAKDEAISSEMERLKTQRGRASTILNTATTGKGTLG